MRTTFRNSIFPGSSAVLSVVSDIIANTYMYSYVNPSLGGYGRKYLFPYDCRALRPHILDYVDKSWNPVMR